MRPAQIITSALILFASALAGCGDTPASVTQLGATCPAGTAQIGIFDGYALTMCGCQETAGARSTDTVGVTCTLNRDSVVYFDFSPSQNQRLLIPETTALGFSASPLYEPGAEVGITSHAVLFRTPGQFAFRDTFDPRIRGTIVIQ